VHIYAFGSVCRGEVSTTSDIDLLAAISGHDPRFDAQIYSIYSYARLREIWNEGNPFAWHLHLESKLIFSSDGSDFLRELGPPSQYTRCRQDCKRFADIFRTSRASLEKGFQTSVFDLSTAFLGIRNFASCFSLGVLKRPNFSRHSALKIEEYSIKISPDVYSILERSRLLSTRAIGKAITPSEVRVAAEEFSTIELWLMDLTSVVESNERL